MPREYSSSSSSRSSHYPSDAKSSSQEKAYKPSGSTTKSSGSTTKSSSHRTSSNPKVVIDYPSTYKDPDRRSKYQDSSYLP